MRVLLVENEPEVGRTVSARLIAAGVAVERCRPPGATDYACEGMPTGHGCPLDGTGTDAAVVVRSPDGGPVTELESGVACALRLGVPVALIGGTRGATYLPWVSGDASDPADSLAAVEAAARRGRAQLCAPARAVARQALGSSDEGGAIDVQVEYAGDRLRADVQVAAPLDAQARERIAVRVAGVLRPRARWAKAIDVAVRGDQGSPAATRQRSSLEPEP